MPRVLTSDNGNTFIANLWKEIHAALNIKVDYTPPYHSSSLGGVERQHRDIKLGLKTTLRDMGDQYGTRWMDRLPWVMLGRRTTFQPALDATAAELVFGSNPLIPGDMAGEPGPPLRGEKMKQLLEGLRQNAARPPRPTTHNREQKVNYPEGLANVTHVWVRRHKNTPLGQAFDGPFPIVQRQGTSCVTIRVGSYASGEPRMEVQHWNNLKPAVMGEGEKDAERRPLGRKPLNPEAKAFVPETRQAQQQEQPHQTETPPEPQQNEDTAQPKDIKSAVSARPVRIRRKPARYCA